MINIYSQQFFFQRKKHKITPTYINSSAAVATSAKLTLNGSYPVSSWNVVILLVLQFELKRNINVITLI
jgi:hypothetical protein